MSLQDVVITALPEPKHVQGVYKSIITDALPKKDRVFIDSSTIDPSTSRQVAKSVADAGQGLLLMHPCREVSWGLQQAL